MTTILQINSAARSQGAQSTLLANELTAKLQQSNAGANGNSRVVSLSGPVQRWPPPADSSQAYQFDPGMGPSIANSTGSAIG